MLTNEGQGSQAGSESTAPSNDGGGDAPSSVEPGETPAAGEPAPYTPNYGFRFYGQQAEMEEWARGFIKDKDTEDRFRGLYAKSHAFETVRERLKTSEAQITSVQEEMATVQTELKDKSATLDHLQYLRDNDLYSFFDFADIPVDRVIDFVEQHLKDLKLPQAEQDRIANARQQLLRARELEVENQSIASESEQRAIQSHTNEFTDLMDHPEVAEFATQYDGVVGKPGAFRMAVIDHGEAVEKRTGKSLSPLEATRAVYQQFKPFMERMAAAGADPQDPAEEVPQTPPARERRPVVPTVGGAGARAPQRKVYDSIESLKARHKELVAAEGNHG